VAACNLQWNFRNVSTLVDLLEEHSGFEVRMPPPPRPQAQRKWRGLAEPAIGRMLYRLGIYYDWEIKVTPRGRSRLTIDGEVIPDRGLWLLATFIIFHRTLEWNFPDVSTLVPGFRQCNCRPTPLFGWELCPCGSGKR
jgi:hypothetical protein